MYHPPCSNARAFAYSSHFFRVLLLIVAVSTNTEAQAVIPLWNGAAPHSHGTKPIDIPTLTLYLPHSSQNHRTPAVIILPGGGYVGLVAPYETINPARWFETHGIAGLVLQYRLPSNGYLYPVPLLDAQRAIRLVRSHATEWNIDLSKVGIMGFSAGGHLASVSETHFDLGDPNAPDSVSRFSCRPDFAVLVYPVINAGLSNNPEAGFAKNGTINFLIGNPVPPTSPLLESLSSDKQVTAQTPPTVLVFSDDDKVVDPENEKPMFRALQKAGVPSALQEYPRGGHGFGVGFHPDYSPPGWLDRVCEWLKSRELL